MIQHCFDRFGQGGSRCSRIRKCRPIPFFRRTIELSKGIAERLPAKQVDYINTPRTEQQTTQLASVLRSVIDKYGDLKYKGRTTYGEAATSELFELQRLQVGLEAPEIEGSDLDEIGFKLSDYRGKVVMLDFRGHWCPPCRAMYPHERELNRKLADKPFVLLGVNSDGDLDEARAAVSSENLSWRHFWNGPNGTRPDLDSMERRRLADRLPDRSRRGDPLQGRVGRGYRPRNRSVDGGNGIRGGVGQRWGIGNRCSRLLVISSSDFEAADKTIAPITHHSPSGFTTRTTGNCQVDDDPVGVAAKSRLARKSITANQLPQISRVCCRHYRGWQREAKVLMHRFVIGNS